MSTKRITAWIDGAVQEIEVEDIVSGEQNPSIEDRLVELEDKPIITDGNFLVGKGTVEPEEVTPEQVLDLISGAKIVYTTEEEFDGLLESEAVNANYIYVPTDAEEKVYVQTVNGAAPDENGNVEVTFEGLPDKPFYDNATTIISYIADENNEFNVSDEGAGYSLYFMSETLLSSDVEYYIPELNERVTLSHDNYNYCDDENVIDCSYFAVFPEANVCYSINDYSYYPQKAGTYLIIDWGDSVQDLTIQISDIKQIDEKFIPDSVKVNPSLSVNDENDPRYVDGRTHYSEGSRFDPISHTSDEWTESDYYHNGYDLARCSYDTPSYEDVLGGTLTIDGRVIQLTEDQIETWDSGRDYDDYISIAGGLAVIIRESGDSGDPTGIFIANTGETIELTFPEQIKKLDSKYIGDDIARVSDLQNINLTATELITVDDIDTICGATIYLANEVEF